MDTQFRPDMAQGRGITENRVAMTPQQWFPEFIRLMQEYRIACSKYYDTPAATRQESEILALAEASLVMHAQRRIAE